MKYKVFLSFSVVGNVSKGDKKLQRKRVILLWDMKSHTIGP
jgi:hypothetical protein